jgi:hypothetical protein
VSALTKSDHRVRRECVEDRRNGIDAKRRPSRRILRLTSEHAGGNHSEKDEADGTHDERL